MKLVIFELLAAISSHPNFSLLTQLDRSQESRLGRRTETIANKEHISIPTEFEIPVSISCLCQNGFTGARPRPSSRVPPVNKTRVGDLPE
jgi:hypothetical protein